MPLPFDRDNGPLGLAYENASFDSAKNLVFQAMSVAPVAFGVREGFRRLKSNDPSALLGLSTNRQREFVSIVGDNLRGFEHATRQSRQAQVEKFVQGLVGDGSDIQKLLQTKSSERNAILASILETIDDPQLLDSHPDLRAKRDALSQLIGQENLSTESQEMIERVTRTILEDPKRSSQFKSSYSAYRGIGAELAAPQLNLRGTGGPAFNPIGGQQLPHRAATTYSVLQGAVSQAGGSVSVHTVQEGSLGVSYYAKVTSATGRELATSIPLDVVRAGRGGGVMAHQVPILRLGSNLSTPRVGVPFIGNAPAFIAAHSADGQPELTKSTMRRDYIGLNKPVQTIEQYYVTDFIERLGRAGGNLDAIDTRELGEVQRSFTETLPRYVISGSKGPLRTADTIAAKQASMQTIVWTGVERMPQAEALRFASNIAASASLDPSEQFFRPDSKPAPHRTPMGTTMRTGLQGGETRLAGGITNQITDPLTARSEQQVGREFWFEPDQYAGPVSNRSQRRTYGLNMAVADDMARGASNRAIVLQVPAFSPDGTLIPHATSDPQVLANRKLFAGLGEGEALMQSGGRITQNITRSILNPDEHVLSATPLLQEMRRQQKAQGYIELTEDLIRQHGTLLGTNASGQRVSLDVPTGLERMVLTETRSQAGGSGGVKYLLHFSGNVTLNQQRTKLFSDQFKGTTKREAESVLAANMAGARVGGAPVNGVLSTLGVRTETTIFTESSMLGKSVDNLINNMIGGMEIVAGDFSGVPVEARHRMHAQWARTRVGDIRLEGRRVGIEKVKLHRFARHTSKYLAEAVAKGKISPEEAGAALAGLRGYGAEYLGLTDQQFHRYFVGLIRNFGRGLSTGEQASLQARVDRAARSGIALSMGSFSPAGSPYNTYGDALASIESRQISFLSYRLQNVMGLSRETSADVITALLARNENIGNKLQATRALQDVAFSAAGVDDLTAARLGHKLKQGGAKVINWKEFLDATAGGDQQVERWLKSQGAGVIVDFTGDHNIQAAAEHAMRGSRSLYLAGGDVLEAMSGTKIKVAGETKDIAPDYVRRVARLRDDITILASTPATGPGGNVFTRFRDGMAELFSGSLFNLTRGKVAGSIFAEGAFRDIGEMSFDEKKVAREIFRKTKGNAVFLNSVGFVSAMKSFRQASEMEIRAIGNGSMAKQASMNDAIKKMELFFMSGTEARRGKEAGVIALGGRHPTLGVQHFGPVQVFRDVRETTGAGMVNDQTFERFARSKSGTEIIDYIERKSGIRVSSFGDLTFDADTDPKYGKVNKTTLRKKFFKTMLLSIDEWATTGGAVSYVPKFDVDVEFKGVQGSKAFSLNWASLMFGDADGDAFHFTFAGKEMTSRLIGVMSDKDTLRRNYLAAIRTNVFREEIKRGINLTGKELGVGMEAYDIVQRELAAAQGNIAKEIIAKDVGSLDIRLRVLKEGTIRYAEKAEADMAAVALDLLTVLQEDPVLKAKKLNEVVDISRPLISAIDSLIAGEGTEAFDNVLRQMIFNQSALWDDGFEVSGIRNLSGGDSELMKLIQDEIRGKNISLQGVVKFLGRIGSQVRSTGEAVLTSQGRLETALSSGSVDAQEAYEAVLGRLSQESALLNGPMDDLQRGLTGANRGYNHMQDVVGRLDKRVLGPVALGLGASIGVAALLGSEGYAPAPLVMPGESVSPRIHQAINAGSVFREMSEVGPTIHDMEHPAAPPIMNPINTGESYFARRNAYQIRGQVQSGSAASQVAGFMDSIGGSAHVRINDTRRPVTSNYIDRIMGD